MKHIKLTHGKSYRGHGIYATHIAPDVFTDDMEAVNAVLATGYFEEVEGEEITPPPSVPTGTIEVLDTMGVTKLREYAKAHGLDLSWPAGTEADVIRADIKAAMTSDIFTTDMDE